MAIMKNATLPTYPAKFTGFDLDTINYHLREGYANEKDARDMVKWWNESGKRFTRASLIFVTTRIGLAPQIKIEN
jgi:hypothetical protein